MSTPRERVVCIVDDDAPLRRSLRNLLMLTAHADAETRRRALGAGAAAFLEKRVRSAALLDAIRTALASA